MEGKPQEPYEYEVDLRDYIEVIWREKWLILLIFLVAAGVAYGFSKTEPSQYETETTLLVTPRISEQLAQEEDEGLVGSSLSVSVYRRSALAKDLLQKIIEELDLRSEEDELVNVGSLEGKLEVEIEMDGGSDGSADTNMPLITMKVTGTDPENIEQIANKWADLFIEKNTELLSSEQAKSFEFISSRFQEVKEDLSSKEEEKIELKRELPLEVLKSELKVIQRSYEDFATQLERKKAQLEGKRARLSSLENSLEEETEFLNLERSIPEGSLWELLREIKSGKETAQDEDAENDVDSLEDWEGFSVTDQEVNEAYFNLLEEMRTVQADISSFQEEVNYLEKKTDEFAKEIKENQFQIDKAQQKIDQLDREINRLEDTYNTLSANLEEARIANEEKESSIRVMERAVTPGSPMGTNTKQNVAVAGVLGLFIGVLVAFFKNYMQDFELEEEEDEEDNEES